MKTISFKPYFLFLSFVLLFLPFNTSKGQSKERGPIFQNFDIRLGAGAFWQDNQPDLPPLLTFGHSAYTSSPSIGWSLMLDFELNRKLGLSTGFKSSTTVFTADLSDLGIWSAAGFPYFRTLEFDMKTWEIPMSLRFYFNREKRLRPYLDISMGVNNFHYFKRTGQYHDPQGITEDYTYNREERTQWNLSYSGGVGLYYDISPIISVALDLRYQKAEMYYFHSVDDTSLGAENAGELEIAIQRPVIGLGIYGRILHLKRED
ncbi:MAG: outer membrane beta-barrel protein [Bacteroidota bacterium]